MNHTGGATSSSTSADESKPPQPAVKRSWGDDEEESSIPRLDQLTIDESKKVDKFLDEPEVLNDEAVASGDSPFSSAATFEDLNLSPELLKGLYVEMKYRTPSKIQAMSLPLILTPPFNDLIAQAHNGSGKTTCFVLGMLSRVDPNLKKTQALCICPTRELAIQNTEVLRKIGKYTGITSACAVPLERSRGAPSESQVGEPSQVVIGTPGTLKRWIWRKSLTLEDVKILVFDEADQMLAVDGFQADSLSMMKDIRNANAQCQVLLFSATFDEAVKNFVSRTVKKEHNQVFVKKEELSLDLLKHYKVTCSDEEAKVLVVKERILESCEKLGQAIIFVNSRRSAAMLHKSLKEGGYEITTIHGARTTEDRDKIVKEFKDGITQVLISTDLLARGFDQQQVNLVVNYDLPVRYGNPSEPAYEVYLHRNGRAGRFGGKGAVFNLVVDDRDQMIMDKIGAYFGISITEVPRSNNAEDFETCMRAAGLI